MSCLSSNKQHDSTEGKRKLESLSENLIKIARFNKTLACDRQTERQPISVLLSA